MALLDAAGKEVDEALANEQAWCQTGRTLRIGDCALPLRINAPVVEGLWAPPLALAGYPVAPVPQKLRFCEPGELRWRWWRSAEPWCKKPEGVGAAGEAAADARVLVGSERVYVAAECLQLLMIFSDGVRCCICLFCLDCY